MTHLEALKTLLEKVEAGVKYETMGHTRLCQRAFPKPSDFDGSRKSYAESAAQRAILVWRNGDFNAAKALHEAVIPEWKWSIFAGTVSVFLMEHPYDGNTFDHKDEDNPARAWLIAIIKALIFIEEKNNERT